MDERSKKYNLNFENVAIPEVKIDRLGQNKDSCDAQEDEKIQSVKYDNVAIPEIHIKKSK